MKNAIFITLVMSFPLTSLSNCFETVGKAYSIDPLLLESIALTESNKNTNVISQNNTNGTYDIGIMQINSFHLETLKKFNISEQDLIKDSCVNITVAGFILSSNIKIRGNTWDAIGAYNAGYHNTPGATERRRLYAEKIKKTYMMLKNNAGQNN